MTDLAIAETAPTVGATPADAVDPARVRALAARVVAGPRAELHTHRTPLDGRPIATLPVSTADDVRVAIRGARAAQVGWAARSIHERAAVLLRFHDLVLAHQDDLLDLVQLESGKVRTHAFEEVADCALVARHYARNAASYLAPTRHRGAFPGLTAGTEHHRPKGVVGVISPWNYPLSLSMTDALPALMAGNAVVLRPDQQSSVTALAGADLLTQAGLPEGVLQVVLGPGPTTGQAVVDQADYVCYTGSTATGRRVAQSAAARLVGSSMELGGKNSMYVADDADLDRAVEGGLRMCFASAGQLCVSAERLLVHDGVWDAFVPRFVEGVRGLRLGVALDWGPQMGSLVGPAQLATVQRHVADAVAHGATVLTGGRHRPDIGPFVYEPTLLTGVNSAMECRDGETFGPVVALYRVRSDDEAVTLANDTEYGLNASVWTRDPARGRRIAERLQVGTVNVNEGYAAAWSVVGGTQGGWKASGMGRRHGRDGILKYTEAQNVTVQRLTGFGPLPGLGDRGTARALTAGLRLMKAVGLK